MRKIYLLFLATVLAVCSFAQEPSVGIPAGGGLNLPATARSKPTPRGTSLPGTCDVGETYFKTDAAAGQNLYGCTSTNTWTLLGDGGGAGGGDNVSVNGAAAADADFDSATPAAPANGLNVVWQKDALTPNNVSAHILQNAGTDVTADLEEEAHVTEHAENGADELLGEALGTACTENQILKANATGGLDCAADETGAGGGDAITVNTTAVADPDFIDSTTISVTENLVPTPDTITWAVIADSIGPTQIDETAQYAFSHASSTFVGSTFTGDLVGNADTATSATSATTATALAADPAACAANQFGNDTTAAGALVCAQPSFSNLSGAATDGQIPNNITIDLAAAATALAADGANCTAQFPLGVDAAGAVQDCTTISSAQMAAANKTITKSISIIAPTTGDTNLVQIYWPAAVTLTKVECSVGAATSVTIQLDERAVATPNTAGTDSLTGTLACDVDSQSTTSFADAAIAAAVPHNLQITAVSGTPGVVRIHVTATIN